MRVFLYIALLLSCLSGMGQTSLGRIQFQYDASGNRTQKQFILVGKTQAEAETRLDTVYIGPNPTSEMLNIYSAGLADNANAIVYASNGSIIEQMKVLNGTYGLDVHTYPKGHYVLFVRNGEKSYRFVFVVL